MATQRAQDPVDSGGAVPSPWISSTATASGRCSRAAGFTTEVVSPFEEEALLALGLGITNLVERATASAADLSPDELRHGARRLEAKVRRYRPRFLGFLGMTAFRTAFRRPRAALGPQPKDIGGARTWLLPNPSGAQAHYQLPDLSERRSPLCAEPRREQVKDGRGFVLRRGAAG